MAPILAWAAPLAFGVVPAAICASKRRWGGAGLGALLTAGFVYLAMLVTGILTYATRFVGPEADRRIDQGDVVVVAYPILLLASLVVINEAIAHARPGSWWYRRRYDDEQRRFAEFAEDGLRDRSPAEQAMNIGSRDHVADRMGGRGRGRTRERDD